MSGSRFVCGRPPGYFLSHTVRFFFGLKIRALRGALETSKSVTRYGEREMAFRNEKVREKVKRYTERIASREGRPRLTYGVRSPGLPAPENDQEPDSDEKNYLENYLENYLDIEL